MRVTIQVVHTIALNIVRRNLAFPHQIVHIPVLLEHFLHVLNPFPQLAIWILSLQEPIEFFRPEDRGRRLANHEESITEC